jgi:hypothetical protein
MAGLYVLDALEPAEREQIRVHLSTCPQAHAEIQELGGVVPAVAALAGPVESPPELKARVMAAIAAEPRSATAPADGASAVGEGIQVSTRRPVSRGSSASPVRAITWRAPAWASWGAAVAAVVVLAVVGVWALGVQSRAEEAAHRDAIVSEAVAAFARPGSSVAILRPSASGTSTGTGFAAVTADGTAYVVMVGLPQAPSGKTYQAWFIRDNVPTSAGVMTADRDGYAVVTNDTPPDGVEVVALTVEPIGGSAQPTSEPFAVGEVQPV